MKYAKVLVSALFGLLTFASANAAATTGSCPARAPSLRVGGSMSVALVDEWDPEFKENYGTGAYYIKVTLAKGGAYTVWLDGGDTAEIWSFSVDTNWEDESAPFASFDYEEKNNNATQIAYMYADAWDEEDPSSGTYYIAINGDIGQRTTVHFVSGIRSFTQEGEDGSPRRIAVTETLQSEERAQVGDGDFYYVMHLEAGRKYRIWAAGATQPVRIETEQLADLSPEGDGLYETYFGSLFPGYSSGNGVAYVVYPSVTGDYILNMSTPNSVSQNFKILYQAFKKLLPEEHQDKVLLSSSNGFGAEIMPGRENSDGVDVYDNVIDETLCKINVAQGERWIFDTTRATNSVLMRVYNADGAVVAENETKGNGDFNVRAAFTAAYSGAYYVGVCQPNLRFDDEPDEAYTVSIAALKAEEFDSLEAADDYDDKDDTYVGASIIVPVPGTSSNSVVEAAAPHGPHVLSGRDWYDWFCFAGRGGVTYRLKASWAGEGRTDLALRTQVYKMVNGTVGVITPSFGTLTPGGDTAALTFTADEDAMYYIGVSVAEPLADGSLRNCVGLDFPAYNIHALGYVNGLNLGLLKVETHGADGTWTLDDQVAPPAVRMGSVQFVNGATPLVIADCLARVNFQPVTGYTTPASQVVTPTAGKTIEVVGRYVDSLDPKDDSAALADILKGGFSVLAPASAETAVQRTLWSDDATDVFLFLAQEGTYYSFGLEDTTEALTSGTVAAGDAVMKFLAYKDGALVPVEGLEAVTKVEKRLFDPGYVVVQVCHSSAKGSEVDSCYALRHKSANVGTISFAAEAVSATKGDAYVDLVLKRSASEGAVSVRYVTVAGTALPGEDYFPTSEEGVVRWEDGDSADKTVRVRLIPSLYNAWVEDRAFQVAVAAFAEDAMADDEYPAVISGSDRATVTITSAVEKNPGTVSLLDQPLVVTAGDGTFKLRLERTGGSNGRIALALYTNPGTAEAGTDYKSLTYTVVEWADGEEGVKEVPFETFNAGTPVAKTVNLGMMAVTADYRSAGYGDYRDCLVPTVATPSAVVTVASLAAQETGDFLAFASAAGVGITTPIGSWYSDGTLRSGELAAGGSARIGFIVEGPGFLKVDPQVENGGGTANMIYLVGSGTVQDCTDHSGPMVLTVPAGRQTVLFQVNSPDGGAYATFANVDNGEPFKWMPLSTMSVAAPLSGAVVPAYGEALAWTAPEGGDKESICYRVKLGVTESATPYQATEETFGLTAPISSSVVAGYITNVVSKLGIGQSTRFYWTVECAYTNDLDPDFSTLSWISAPNVWNFAVSGPGTPATLVSGADALGTVISAGAPIELVEGVYFEADLAVAGYAGDISGCVGGTLPPGLSASGMKITGVPSKAGTYRALVEAAVGPYFATTTELEFHVAEAGIALGSFGGVLAEDGSASPLAALRNLLLTFSATADGSISAKINYFGGSLPFSSARGFSEYDAEGDALIVDLASPVTYDGLTYSNTVNIVVPRGSLEDPAIVGNASGDVIGDAEVRLWLRDASGVPTERVYVCDLSRYNADSAVFTEAMEAFEGYYTFALAPQGPLPGEPCGNGVMTMTVSKNGIVRFAGTLADGTAVSMASFASLEGDLANPQACMLWVPLWATAADYSLGGVVWLVPGDSDGDVKAVYVSTYKTKLEWTKDGDASTYDGAGFRLSLLPSGGWYDTVVNLQRHYLGSAFTVETEPVTGIPEYLRYPGLAYTIDSTPHGVEAVLNGNELSPVATSFVMDGRRFDLSKSLNPWGVKFSFNRGNGLVDGTFSLITDNGSDPQGYAATLTHKGVLLMNCDPKSPFVDLLTAGFYLMPSSKNGWQISRPFNIRATAVDPDWSEAELR